MLFNPVNAEQNFAKILGEWNALVQKREQRLRAQGAKNVQHWKRRVEVFKREHQALISSGKWIRGPSDVLSIIGKERWETYHSAMLAWLLDPIAPHRLGPTFLEAFMQACDPSWSLDDAAVGTIRPACEVWRPGCRADVVVWSSSFTLVIENKVDALEGQDQCDRLFEAFQDVPEPRFVFLTRGGHDPTTVTGEAAQAFRPIGYKALKKLLVDTLHHASPSSSTVARSTLRNYQRTLDRLLR